MENSKYNALNLNPNYVTGFCDAESSFHLDPLLNLIYIRPHPDPLPEPHLYINEVLRGKAGVALRFRGSWEKC